MQILLQQVGFELPSLWSCQIPHLQSPLSIEKRKLSISISELTDSLFLFVREIFEQSVLINCFNKLLKSDSDVNHIFFKIQHKKNRTFVEHCN